MDVRLRIQTSRLIEQMDKHPEIAKQLGIDNISVFYGEREKRHDIKEEQQK